MPTIVPVMVSELGLQDPKEVLSEIIKPAFLAEFGYTPIRMPNRGALTQKVAEQNVNGFLQSVVERIDDDHRSIFELRQWFPNPLTFCPSIQNPKEFDMDEPVWLVQIG